ncbi:MAG: hypothetical protein QOE91_985, partial [Gaiellaceae bacterium]|nr:hypothetical protein [Gaiellaceae bacterium]
VSSSRPVLVIALSANAEGTVSARWDGGDAIGRYDIRPGTNSVRIVLPRGLKGRKTLILTAASPQGATGNPLRQSVLFVR